MKRTFLPMGTLFGFFFLMIATAASPAWSAPKGPTGPAASDLEITTRVKALFDRDNHVDLRDVDVKTENGIVILSGTVLTHYERGYAVQTAGEIPIVKELVDRIKVVAPLTPDIALAKKIRADLLKNPMVNISKLNVTVEDGSVRLQGYVLSESQKRQAGDLVRYRKQVASLQNEIKVLSEE